jgi:hypothetical protein
MSETMCEKCGGGMYVCAYGGHPLAEGLRVVSKEDAEVAESVREIERDGLLCDYAAVWPTAIGKEWTVYKSGDGPKGEGPTIPAALAAYKKAKEARR